MTVFLRLLAESDKVAGLRTACSAWRHCLSDNRLYAADPLIFSAVPGAPFAYWVNSRILAAFQEQPRLENPSRFVRVGLQTSDDFRFIRSWFEVQQLGRRWLPLAKGGAFSKYYADLCLAVDWKASGSLLSSFSESVIRNPNYYHRPGVTWPRRTTSGLSMRVLPKSCIFADKGPALFVAEDRPKDLLSILAISNSKAFGLFVSLQLAAAEAAARSYEVGVIQNTPIPNVDSATSDRLAALAQVSWSLKRTLDTVEETSHAFVLPPTLRSRAQGYDPTTIQVELNRVESEIDEIVLETYGISQADYPHAANGAQREVGGDELDGEATRVSLSDEDESVWAIDGKSSLLSWATGVVVGRFDWRLATGERAVPPEPEPFDPLPTRSPGMLPEGAEPFHAQDGILVDEPGHPHDLARLVEQVLQRVSAPEVPDVRNWLQREFFDQHLKQYSKSRRKAPIYWPLSTASGSYTLWVYYPSLSNQTLYTAVNDFVEPKLKQVGEIVTALRAKGDERSRAEERVLEEQQDLEQELRELRDELLRLAPGYKPNLDDGVQITAAPLWSLFRHKPWQKVLKTTWEELQAGKYDWAHLAMAYWPNRVREKCKHDKSLAIAHGLEALYIEPEPKPGTEKAQKRGRKKKAASAD